MHPGSRIAANLLGLLFMFTATPAILILMVALNRLTKPKEESKVANAVTFDVAPTKSKTEPAGPKQASQTPRRLASSDSRPSAGRFAALAPAGIGPGVNVGLPDLFVDPKSGPLIAVPENGPNADMPTDATVDRKPVPRTKGPIEPPHVARQKGLSGRVVVMLLVGTDGLVKAVRVKESEPKGVFDDCVTQAVRNWTFDPALYKSQPVEMWATLTVRFSP